MRAGCCLDWAAVIHSSSRRRVTSSRNSVRPIASTISQAWWARNATSRPICDSADDDIRAERAKWLRMRDAGMPRQRAGDDRQERRQRDRRAGRSPSRRAAAGKRQGPSGEQRDERSRRRQGPPQIVEHLPAADRRDGGCALAPARAVATAEHPRQQLPVAARPAVLARGGHVVAGGKFLDDLDVGHQARRGETPSNRSWLSSVLSGTRPCSAASKASTS